MMREKLENSKITPAWVVFIIFLITTTISVVMAFGTLDKRITVLETKSIDRKEFYQEMKTINGKLDLLTGKDQGSSSDGF